MRSITGYTLVEILLVAAVGTIAATLAIPSIQDSLRAYQLAAAADQLASELHAARVLAVSRGTTYSILFNVSQKTYQIIDVSDPLNPTRVEKSLESQVWFSSVPTAPITFYSRGGARGGTVSLSVSGGMNIAVVIEASGTVRVQEMQAGTGY